MLDIGASNGDLLRALTPYVSRRSAFDAVRFPACEAAVSGEYIIGAFEDEPHWSEQPYDLVTAFDVFEHFLQPREAIQNVLSFVKPGGYLVIETGNWRAAQPGLTQWYYCNLFEHQIFWSIRTFKFLCDEFDLELRNCDIVNHKYRRDMPALKRLAISAYRKASFTETTERMLKSMFGVDPRLLAPPRLQDHLFLIVRRKN
jgi:SAM-dependent methyltransferase